MCVYKYLPVDTYMHHALAWYLWKSGGCFESPGNEIWMVVKYLVRLGMKPGPCKSNKCS